MIFVALHTGCVVFSWGQVKENEGLFLNVMIIQEVFSECRNRSREAG